MTIWGRPKESVPEGHCKDCEEAMPLHHESCPIFDKFKEGMSF